MARGHEQRRESGRESENASRGSPRHPKTLPLRIGSCVAKIFRSTLSGSASTLLVRDGGPPPTVRARSAFSILLFAGLHGAGVNLLLKTRRARSIPQRGLFAIGRAGAPKKARGPAQNAAILYQTSRKDKSGVVPPKTILIVRYPSYLPGIKHCSGRSWSASTRDRIQTRPNLYSLFRE